MSAVVRIFRGLWRGLDGLRKFLHLLLLLIFFGFVLGAIRGTIPHLPAKAALVIRPEGQIVEQLSSDPVQRAFDEASGQGESQTLLWDLLDAIRAAAADKRVEAMVLQLDDFDGAGQPTLEEVAVALREFRAAKKKIIAQASSYTQAQYYLAAQADEIYLDPFGAVLIDGYDRYRMYYKGALDKLSIDMHLIRVGAYKSAGEPYMRTDMSAEDKEESLAYLNALWGGYQNAVSKERQLPRASLANYANGYIAQVKAAKGDTAQVALQAGLVTALKAWPDVEQRVVELVGADDETHSFHAISYSDYTRVLKAEKKLRGDGKQRIGVIVASGEILDGDQPPGTIGGENTAALIREARQDDDVRAVVLRINSPGGSVIASEQIYREVLALKKAGKPVVVSMGDLAASGGYYIAAPADQIIASPMTITGSIGIFAVIPTIDRALGRLGVTVDGVGTTDLSGRLRIDRPLDPASEEFLQVTVQHGYDEFLGHVAAGRSKSREEVHAVAQGRVWIGSEALRLGLVDKLGNYADAVKAAAELANLGEHYRVERVEPKLTWVQQLAMQIRIRAAGMAGQVWSAPAQRLNRTLAQFAPLQREVEFWQRMSTSERTFAYCFCTAQ
ncbi:MAG: signal peptide peptidase SppA [Steroidobacteraceae bacterium]